MKMDDTFRESILSVFLLFLFISTPGHAQDDPIKIAFVGDFSDVTKVYCLSAYRAAQMAVKEINDTGGLLDRKVELIKKNAGVDPQKHYAFVTDMARQNNIVAVFGGASSACLLRASDASQEQRIPYLISVGNSQTVVTERGHPYVFLFEANSWMETKAFSIFTTLMPWKRYAWLGPDYIWGREVFQFFKQQFEEIGNPIRWTVVVWHPLDHKEYGASIRKIIDSNPEALVIASWGEDMRRFVVQAKSYGLIEKMAVFGWFMSEGTGRLIPQGVWTLTRAPFYYLAGKLPQTKRFTEQFNENYNCDPTGFAICSYDALMAWRLAVQKANSPDPEAVAKELKGLSFVGLRGDSYIRAIDGQMNCPTYFGRLVYLSDHPTAVLESVIEIPANKTWLSESEVVERRMRTKRSLSK